MPKFKNGTYVNKIKLRTSDGKAVQYLRISAGPLRGQYVHRLIVAARIGRPLLDWEHVDHRNGHTLDDTPDNLSDPISASEHAAITNARAKQKLLVKREKEARKKLKAKGAAAGSATDFHFGAND